MRVLLGVAGEVLGPETPARVQALRSLGFEVELASLRGERRGVEDGVVVHRAADARALGVLAADARYAAAVISGDARALAATGTLRERGLWFELYGDAASAPPVSHARASWIVADEVARRSLLARGVAAERLAVVPRAVDGSLFAKVGVERPNELPIVLWTGPLGDASPWRAFLELCSLWTADAVPVEVWIAGDAGAETLDQRWLVESASALGLASSFRWFSGLEPRVMARVYSAVAASGGVLVADDARPEALLCACPVARVSFAAEVDASLAVLAAAIASSPAARAKLEAERESLVQLHDPARAAGELAAVVQRPVSSI